MKKIVLSILMEGKIIVWAQALTATRGSDGERSNPDEAQPGSAVRHEM